MYMAIFALLSVVGAWAAWRGNPLYSRMATLRFIVAIAGGAAVVVGIILATLDLTAKSSPIVANTALGLAVLVGTIAVESSELLSRMLKREGIIHNVLNAKFVQQEAEIVANAGQRGAVTIATNMAGRGTDIKLGPGVNKIQGLYVANAKQRMVEVIGPDTVINEEAGEHATSGLYVIGTERHESRRIDRQLRGRCARQGDPGVSKFFVSFEDYLMRNFGDSRRLGGLMTKLGMKDD